MKKHHNRVCKLMCIMLSFLMLSSMMINIVAENNEEETVTVAYIDYNRFIEKDDNGKYTGYGAEYLYRIAQYTGWRYEFVEMDWPTAFEAVKAGTVDFYCVARQTTNRESDFDFSLYPICNEEMNLYTLAESSVYYDDFKTFDGMRIGMLSNSNEIDYFKEYALKHGFTYTLVEYPMNEDAIKALETKEVDAVALVNYSIEGKYKLVSNFGVAPAYLMSHSGSKYMDEFSNAQQQLYFDEPNYLQRLNEKYYAESSEYIDIQITREEAEFIESSPTLNVAISYDLAPIEYKSENDQFEGLTVGIFERISEMTGLHFNFVQREDSATLVAQMKNGDVNIVGVTMQNDFVSDQLSITQTNSFSDNTILLITKDLSKLNSSSIVAVPTRYPRLKNEAIANGYTNIIEIDSFDECVRAVFLEKADFTYIFSTSESYLMSHSQYNVLKLYPTSGEVEKMCFGVYNQYDQRLVSIINKCIDHISASEIKEMIISNSISVQPKLTFNDFIVKYRLVLFISGVILIALVALTVIRYQKNKQQLILNSKLQKNRDYLQHLFDTLPCGVFQYEYIPPHKIIGFNDACARIYGYDNEDFNVIGCSPDVVVQKGTEEAFQRKFVECEETKIPLMYEWPITRRDGSRAYTESMMDVIETDSGKYFREIVVDITERKIREEEINNRYNQELVRTGIGEEGLLFTSIADLSEQIIIESNIDVEDAGTTIGIDALFELISSYLREFQSEKWVNDFKKHYSYDEAKKSYERGQFERVIKVCRRKSQDIQWLRVVSILRIHPVSGHLMSFDYIYDITDQQVPNTIINMKALINFDGFMQVDMKTSRCLQYDTQISNNWKHINTEYGKTDLLCTLAEKMNTKDAIEFKKTIELPIVYERLQNQEYYEVYATLHNQTGNRLDKSIVFTYIDEDNGIIAVTVSDVTEVRASEVRHAQLLADALKAAEKADIAKSQFLSRVSHEMRTPLNAIIGFIELAKDGDKENVANCLASSDIAAKQLLSVINDVLDMSSIEYGKMKIANNSFDFRKLLTSITNMYGTQCKQKGIAFESRLETPVDDWIVGDELRVNQILMNILGNSIKFTSQGRISLVISQTAIDDKHINIHFTISDTGCGMSDEMKTRLFKPFEQQSASTAKQYGGSGLGLSIVKSLVNIMNGKISVESELNKGTSFVIDLPFEKNAVDNKSAPIKKIEDIHVLVVDDEIEQRSYMNLVLTRMKVRFKIVSSGDEALEELEKSNKVNDLYNVCLVDWQMPKMGGVETTRKIRQIYGQDLIVIIVSAYSFQQAEKPAKAAGADVFITKPIFQSSLYDTFMNLTSGKIAKQKTDVQDYDFTGKRVLLAEDNVLNQIVAQGYLAKYNVVVDLAKDGKETLDKFSNSPPNYYDAILMDIQMPIMDGYEATKAIRACNHPQAKTIQIIAQSADAFNEDVARALSVGMNGHIAKPIKLDILASVLFKAFETNK